MGSIITFLSNNYIWFLIISLILIFALIGYLVDTEKDDRFTKKINLNKDFSRRMEAASAMNLSMNDVLNENKIVKDSNKESAVEVSKENEKSKNQTSKKSSEDSNIKNP